MKRYWWELYEEIWNDAERESPCNHLDRYRMECQQIQLARAEKGLEQGRREYEYNPLYESLKRRRAKRGHKEKHNQQQASAA